MLSTRVLRRVLLACAAVMVAGSLLHLAIAVGGADWYAAFHAPPALVALARRGHWYPPLSACAIALMLAVAAAYAVSAAQRMPRLPLTRIVLAGIGIVLSLRGLLFIPIALANPPLLARVCDCKEVDAFIVLTSILCLLVGTVYLAGALGLRRLEAERRNP